MRRGFAIVGLDAVGPLTLALYAEEIKELRRQLTRFAVWVYEAIPPYTPPSWTTLFTGVGVNVHGVAGFSMPRVDKHLVRLSFVSSRNVKFPRHFEIAALYGASYVAVDVPVTYPSSNVLRNKDSVIIAGMPAPRLDYSPRNIPPKVISLLERRFRILAPMHVPAGTKEIVESAQLTAEICELLLDEYSPDIFTVVFRETDTYLHACPRAAAMFDEGYSKVLECVSTVIDTVMRRYRVVALASDHGFATYRGVSLPLLTVPRMGRCPSQVTGVTKLKIMFERMLLTYAPKLVKEIYINSRWKFRTAVAKALGKDIKRSKSPSSVAGYVVSDTIDMQDCWMFYSSSRSLLKKLTNIYTAVYGEYVKHIEELEIAGVPAVLIVPKYDEGHYFVPDLHFDGSRGCAAIVSLPNASHHPIGFIALSAPGVEPGFRGVADQRSLAPTLLSLANIPNDIRHREVATLVPVRRVFDLIREKWVLRRVKRRVSTR